MERYCSTGQSPQRAVAPTEKEEEKLSLKKVDNRGDWIQLVRYTERPVLI
jgi:hypothetical protein